MEMKIEEVWTLLNSKTFLIVSMILVSKVSSVKEVCGGGPIPLINITNLIVTLVNGKN